MKRRCPRRAFCIASPKTGTWPRQPWTWVIYISLSGIVTFRNADALRDVARQVPADRLLVETDSPYLAPIPHRGKPNLPEYVREVADYLAMLRGESYERFAEQTTENFKRLFPLGSRRRVKQG